MESAVDPRVTDDVLTWGYLHIHDCRVNSHLLKNPRDSRVYSLLCMRFNNTTLHSSSLSIYFDTCTFVKKVGIQLIHFNIDEVVRLLESV